MPQTAPARLPSRVLLVESDLWAAGLIQEAIDEIEDQPVRNLLPWKVELFLAETLAEAQQALRKESYEVILLNLELTDSSALHTYLKLREAAEGIPIVILCTAKEEYLALAALREGAFSYLLREDIDCQPLARTLRSAIERQQAIAARAELPLLDDLTHLVSREGFLLLGEQSLQLAARWRKPATLHLVELARYPIPQSTMTRETEEARHDTERQAHDLALIETGDMLRACFAQSDVLARLTGDRFAALTFEDNADEDLLDHRITKYIAQSPIPASSRACLSFVAGSHTLIPGQGSNLDQLLRGAEQALCENKRRDYTISF